MLPSPSTSHWLYAQHSQLPDLISRNSYSKQWIPLRSVALRQHITKYQPRVVIFYSFKYLRHWKVIIGAPLQSILGGDLYARHDGNSLYLVLKHLRGVANEYFHEAGRYIRLALEGNKR